MSLAGLLRDVSVNPSWQRLPSGLDETDTTPSSLLRVHGGGRRMAGNTDALRSKVAAILMSPAAQGIDFYLDNIHVDGSGFSYVALALVSAPKSATGISFAVGGLSLHAAATYDPVHNLFRFPNANYGSTAVERMIIVHECVHALRDSLGKKMLTKRGPIATRAVSDEAAALVAGALFFLLEAGPTSATDTTPDWAQSGVYSNAMSLAIQVLQSPKGSEVKNVNSVGLEAIKAAILHNAAYTSLKSNPGTVYGNNGVRL